MADGSVIIGVNLDTKKAEKELAKYKKDIESTESAISEQETKKSPLVAQAERLNQEMKQARAEVQRLGQQWAAGVAGADGQQARAQERLAQIQTEYEDVVQQIDKIDAKLLPAYDKLDHMKEEAGGLAQQLGKAEKNTRKMEKASKKASKHMGVFATRLRGIVLSAFVFNILSRGFRELTEWMGKIIKNNDEARASIAKLKASLLVLAQPLVDIVVPAFVAITEYLAKAVLYIAQLVSILFGTTGESAKDSAESLYKEQQAIEGVGDAAKKTSGYLASFDEINKMSSEDASDFSDVIAPDFSSVKFGNLPEWLTSMTVNLSEILFKWEDLTAKDVLKKVVASLTTLAGAVIGFSLGGVGGAVLGMTIGAGLGAWISDLTFNGDKKLNTEELLKTLCVALTAIAGGILGFSVGGVKGAAIGVTVGMSVGAGVSSLLFDGDGKVNTEELLKTLCTALLAIAGGVIGFSVGGVNGAAIGVTVGASAGVAIGKMLFNGDGVMSEEEILKSLCAALLLVAGGVLGFMAGGPFGAAIGVTVGAGLSASIGSMIFDSDGVMNTEELLSLLCVALGTLAGGILGFVVGGPGGAILGITIGSGVSAYIGNILFDNDGVMDKEEIFKSVCTALFALAGGIIGFVFGGAAGAGIGLLIGATASLALSNFVFNNDGVMNKDEIAKLACVALFALAGGVIGFIAAGPAGALIGVIIGASASLALSNLIFKNNGKTEKENLLRLLCAALGALVGGAIGFVVGGPMGAAIGVTIGATATIKLTDVLFEGFGSVKKNVPNFKGIGPDYSWMFKTAVPGLATGAVIPPNREFLAVLGDQKSGTNIETPLATMVQAFRTAMQESGGNGNTTIVFKGEMAALARVLRPYIEEEGRRVGVALVTK